MESMTLFDAASTGAGPPQSSPAPADPTPAPLLLRAPSTGVPGPGLPQRHRRTLLAVDGDSLTHRAFHGYGEDAPHGVLALLAGIADMVDFDAVVVGFDDRRRSWRRERCPEYKAQRPPKPPALSALLDRVPALIADMGIAVMTVDGHEADDVLGSAAAAAVAAGWCAVLATSDRDAFGLVDEHVSLLRLRSGLSNAVAVTPRTIRRTLGIRPQQYVDFAALRGDPSDNLSGVPGIGARRARELLCLYPSVAEAVTDELGCSSVLGADLAAALLADYAHQASRTRRNLELMAIRRDAPVDVEACATRRSAERVEAACSAHGLGAVAARMAAGFGARPEPAPPPPTAPLHG